MQKSNAVKVIKLIVPMLVLLLPVLVVGDSPRVIEITATHDAKFKVAGQKDAVITVKVGEAVRLRITAEKCTMFEKDGAVHSFTVRGLQDQGWNLRLKEGTQEFNLVVPDKPGEYPVGCNVMCDPKHHIDMLAKLIVEP